MYQGSRPGSIEVISGVMFSGKSEELIRRVGQGGTSLGPV
jgi:thymidine kinase